jgi:hypothetical protein
MCSTCMTSLVTLTDLAIIILEVSFDIICIICEPFLLADTLLEKRIVDFKNFYECTSTKMH